MLRKRNTPYLRDVYLAYLIDGAKRTETDGFPIIEEWMVADKPPKELIQWDRRYDVADPNETGISFYCSDLGFQPILNNPKAYVDKLRKYEVVVGLDASPYDNMPLWVQKSQIGLNLSITYYYGTKGIKVIPNVRLGDNRTISSLEAYPHHTLIAVGTNGFVKRIKNRVVFAEQVQIIIDTLEPTGICVYGTVPDEIFSYAGLKGIPVYQYDSFIAKESIKKKSSSLSEVKQNEKF